MVKLTNLDRANFKRMCRKYGVDYQLIDLEALWDSSLTRRENYSVLKRELKKYTHEPEVNLEKYEELSKEFQLEQLNEILEASILAIKKQDNVDLSPHYQTLYDMIDVAFKSNVPTLFIIGKQGIGKTFNTIKHIRELGLDYEYIAGNITPLELYHALYENREADRFVVFDDVLAMLKNKHILALLYSALWSPDNHRILKWRTTSKRLKAPVEFEFKAKCIFLMNELPRNKNPIAPLLDRCNVFKLTFSYNEIIEMLYKLAKIKTDKLTIKENFEIVDWIKQHTSVENPPSLRTFIKLQELRFVHPRKWEQLATELYIASKELLLC